MSPDHLTALNLAHSAVGFHLAAANVAQATLANGWAVAIISASESGGPPPPPPPQLQLPTGTP